jgi:hypothetical protein
MTVALMLFAVSVTVPAVVAAQSRPASTPKLQGAWRIIEITGSSPKTYKIISPQPGLWVFTAKHYAFAREDSVRPRWVKPDAPTQSELLNALDFSAQSGTYEIDGNGELVLHRIAALGQSNMVAGNFARMAVRMEGDSVLYMTQRATNQGPTTNAPTTKMRRVE